MQFQIDFRSDIPIYIQILEQVRQKVASGLLRQGDQLPTVRQLATELRVNFNTVARAYRLLDDAGLISTQRGRGTYIWEQPSQETLQALQRESLQGLTRQYLSEAARLGCSLEDVQEAMSAGLAAWQSGDQPVEEE